MISDFIDKCNGFFRLSNEEFLSAKEHNPLIAKEARVIIEYGENRDGHWTGEKFLVNVRTAGEIAEVKYPKDRYDLL